MMNFPKVWEERQTNNDMFVYVATNYVGETFAPNLSIGKDSFTVMFGCTRFFISEDDIKSMDKEVRTKLKECIPPEVYVLALLKEHKAAIALR